MTKVLCNIMSCQYCKIEDGHRSVCTCKTILIEGNDMEEYCLMRTGCN